MKRLAVLAVLLAQMPLAWTQTPEVSIRLDGVLTNRTNEDGKSRIHLYDSLARPSTVRLSALLETGWSVVLAERFEKVPNDADNEQMLEYYIEDPGIWRVGKQLLPFGRGFLVPMYSKAATGDFPLPFVGLPARVSICDDGKGRTRGVVGRVGRNLGVSVANGHSFGIGAQALAALRNPEDSLPEKRGFGTGFAVDYGRREGAWRFDAEIVHFSDGETPDDERLNVSDVSATYEIDRIRTVSIGWTREWTDGLDVIRLGGRFPMVRNVWFEPLVRYRDGGFFDAALVVRVKL